VKVCNASVICDPCTAHNCSGVGVCKDGECMCPSGFTGHHCEITIGTSGQRLSSTSDSGAEDQKETSKMALALTATLTGNATYIHTYTPTPPKRRELCAVR
jgi:hypothetical protein